MKTITLDLTPEDRYIVFSDCHRGDGSAGDEFARNSLLYKCALEHYLGHGFTYIELGDAEELWENASFEPIYITHTSIYELLRAFHHADPERTRYVKIWGNHDLDWKDGVGPLQPVFPGIVVYEAALIRCGERRDERAGASGGRRNILLLHGHQADPICSGWRARLSRSMVRHLWRGVQAVGIGDLTRAAENPGLCNDIDATLAGWAKNGDYEGLGLPPNSSVVAGHTHRPVFENLSLTERRLLEAGFGPPGIVRKERAEKLYYNSGSCVHPRCITGLEITAELEEKGGIRRCLTLVKWCVKPQAHGRRYPLAIERIILQE
ncbi:MAG: hypothetical protein JJE15_09775 [Desulfobacteraceae bacterium]|nr:hypothetical protein [Desulfobacteraceae bacterium]